MLDCRERVAGIANGGAILVTWANHHYLDFAVNWLKHMHQLNITSYMIGAMDDELLKVNEAKNLEQQGTTFILAFSLLNCKSASPECKVCIACYSGGLAINLTMPAEASVFASLVHTN